MAVYLQASETHLCVSTGLPFTVWEVIWKSGIFFMSFVLIIGWNLNMLSLQKCATILDILQYFSSPEISVWDPDWSRFVEFKISSESLFFSLRSLEYRCFIFDWHFPLDVCVGLFWMHKQNQQKIPAAVCNSNGTVCVRTCTYVSKGANMHLKCYYIAWCGPLDRVLHMQIAAFHCSLHWLNSTNLQAFQPPGQMWNISIIPPPPTNINYGE